MVPAHRGTVTGGEAIREAGKRRRAMARRLL